jgi:hypothetical protein
MNQEEFLAQIVQALEASAIPYMVAGSHGSSYHGQPRATIDVDLVIDPSSEQLASFVALLGDRFYLNSDAARAALQNRSMFNVIASSEGWKADLIIRKDRPFSIEEFRRRQPAMMSGLSVPIASPEDVILTKLEWNKLTPSEQQVRDALSVAVVQGSKLDRAYLRHWGAALGVTGQLEEILRKADELDGRRDSAG